MLYIVHWFGNFNFRRRCSPPYFLIYELPAWKSNRSQIVKHCFVTFHILLSLKRPFYLCILVFISLNWLAVGHGVFGLVIRNASDFSVSAWLPRTRPKQFGWQYLVMSSQFLDDITLHAPRGYIRKFLPPLSFALLSFVDWAPLRLLPFTAPDSATYCPNWVTVICRAPC